MIHLKKKRGGGGCQYKTNLIKKTKQTKQKKHAAFSRLMSAESFVLVVLDVFIKTFKLSDLKGEDADK